MVEDKKAKKDEKTAVAVNLAEKQEIRLKPGDYLTKPEPDFLKFVDSQYDKARPKVLIASLTLTMVAQEAYGSHCMDFFHLGKIADQYNFSFVTPRRMPIANLRNLAVEMAIDGDFQYLYFFDDDTVNDKKVLTRLLPRIKEFNAVSASYYVRGYPFSPMAFKWFGKDNRYMKIMNWRTHKRYIDSDGVMRNLAAVGCGCTLFRVEDFKKVSYPWFFTGEAFSEDIYWFVRARDAIKNYKVGMDFNIVCGHLCLPVFVDANNERVMRKFHKALRSVGGITQ